MGVLFLDLGSGSVIMGNGESLNVALYVEPVVKAEVLETVLFVGELIPVCLKSRGPVAANKQG